MMTTQNNVTGPRVPTAAEIKMEASLLGNSPASAMTFRQQLILVLFSSGEPAADAIQQADELLAELAREAIMTRESRYAAADAAEMVGELLPEE